MFTIHVLSTQVTENPLWEKNRLRKKIIKTYAKEIEKLQNFIAQRNLFQRRKKKYQFLSVCKFRKLRLISEINIWIYFVVGIVVNTL